MKRKSISISQFQKNQITQSTFKRNKMYLDFNKLQNDQKQIQLKRRKPQILEGSPKSQLIKQKILKSFRNSVTELNCKLQEQTRRFKQRVSHSPTQLEKPLASVQTGYQTSRTSFMINPQFDDDTAESHHFQSTDSNLTDQLKKDNKIKGIPIDKQISRQYLQRYHVQRNYPVDERNFANFYITKHDLSKTQDFKKLSPRKISFIHEHINDLNYNTQRTYQKFYYSTKPMKPIFRYSVQNSKEGRSFFVPVRPQNVAKTNLDPQKIKKSFTQTSCFKPNKIDPFYKMTGRDLPHQLDQRKLSPNCNFYKDSQGRIVKQKVDYAVKKMYDDLILKQQEEQYRKKNPEFTRNEICDQRYFKEMIKRQNKLLLQK